MLARASILEDNAEVANEPAVVFTSVSSLHFLRVRCNARLLEADKNELLCIW
jgi:hypothetical protein